MSGDPPLVDQHNGHPTDLLVARGLPTASSATSLPAAEARDASDISVELEVNGSLHRLQLDPRATLLDTLRERIGFQGAKKGCDHGQCGACTIHIDGRRVLSCLSGGSGPGEADHHDRGNRRRGWPLAPDAASVPGPRRVSVRVLHARPDHVRDRLRARGSCRLCRRHPGIHERQSLPLRRLRRDRRRDPERGSKGGLTCAVSPMPGRARSPKPSE